MNLFKNIASFLLSMVLTFVFLFGFMKITNADFNILSGLVLILMSTGIYFILKHKKSTGIGLLIGSIFFVLFVIWALSEMD